MANEAPDTRSSSATRGAPGRSLSERLLWPALAVSYLAASAGGYRSIALAAVSLMVGAVVAASGHRMAGAITAFLLSGACLYWSNSMSFFVYLPPIAGFAFMAYFFRRTLKSGSEPLITRVARKEHPDLPSEIARYTRALTWLWTWCFVFLLAAALLLAPTLPLHAWSRWMQGLGVVLPAGLLLGEYAYRHHRLPGHRHAPLPTLMLNIAAVIREAALKTAPADLHDTQTLKRRS